MADVSGEEAQFIEAMIQRTKELRDALVWTQDRMAMVLGVPLERYKKYEYRTPLPGYLVPRLASITNRSIAYVLTGREDPGLAVARRPAKPLPEVKATVTRLRKK